MHYLDRVWEILSQAYRDVPGGLLFKDKSELLNDISLWKVILTKGKVMAVTIFKRKHGLKLVAMGMDKEKFGAKARLALARSIKEDLQHVWMEVSEGAETFVMKQCEGHLHLVHHSLVQSLLVKKVELTEDGYHYQREIAGIPKQKVVVGTPSYRDLIM